MLMARLKIFSRLKICQKLLKLFVAYNGLTFPGLTFRHVIRLTVTCTDVCCNCQSSPNFSKDQRAIKVNLSVSPFSQSECIIQRPSHIVLSSWSTHSGPICNTCCWPAVRHSNYSRPSGQSVTGDLIFLLPKCNCCSKGITVM